MVVAQTDGHHTKGTKVSKIFGVHRNVVFFVTVV